MAAISPQVPAAESQKVLRRTVSNATVLTLAAWALQRLGNGTAAEVAQVAKQHTAAYAELTEKNSVLELDEVWEEAVRTTLQTNTEFVETGELRDGEPLWRLVPPEGAAAAQVLPES